MECQGQRDRQEAEACQGLKVIRVILENLDPKEARVTEAWMVNLATLGHLVKQDFVEAKEREEYLGSQE